MWKLTLGYGGRYVYFLHYSCDPCLYGPLKIKGSKMKVAKLVFDFGVINERIDPKDSCKFENLFSSCSSKDQSKTFVGGIGL